ncbi:hypothetical protein [Paramagnetospirillum kuznetsovii]|nr:hypothetical protein [Paramagnetospirillum kuznetsovii]
MKYTFTLTEANLKTAMNDPRDLPWNFHPAMGRVPTKVTPSGAGWANRV